MRVSPLVVPVTLNILAILACEGNTQACDSGQELRNGACVPSPSADTDTDTDADADTDTGGDAPTTVREVQEATWAGELTLEGLVVTTPVAGDGSFFVQDAGGGMWSGLRVYPDAVEVSVVPGDEVTVSGYVQEYYDETEMVVAAVEDVELTGSGTPKSLKLSSPPADWEAYEGVLVELAEVTLTSEPDGYGEMTSDWDVRVDDYFFPYADEVLPGGTYTFVGVMRWSYEVDKICPRSAADVR